MRSRSLAANSALGKVALAGILLASAAGAETRPRYGGTLRVQTQAALPALPQAQAPTAAGSLAEQVSRLIFEPAPRAGAKPDDGAFRVGEFVPGKRLTLVANDGHAEGRPYLDSIEILMGRSPREQRVDFQLGRADVIDVPVEAMRRASQEGVRLVSSAPLELVALVFSPGGAGGDSDDGARVREAISLSADRAAIFNVLLGRQGEPTAALLPNWLTGYGFLFDPSQNVTRARQLAIEAGRARPIALSYDAHDPLAKSVAERVALDARAAGLVVTPRPAAPSPDVKLVRLTLRLDDARSALAALASALGSSAGKVGGSAEERFQAERRLRDELRVVPLLHLPRTYGVATRVKDWAPAKDGRWTLADVWLEQRP
jgi:hypothetical protein